MSALYENSEYAGSNSNKTSVELEPAHFEHFLVYALSNINCNNGTSVFIPEGYSPILVRDNMTKKSKTIIEIQELKIPAWIYNPVKRPPNAFILFRNTIKDELIKDKPNICNRQILIIASKKWNKINESEKAEYKLQSERMRMQFKSKKLKCKYKTRKQKLLRNLTELFQSII
ncbi:40076_t:CDS:2 [Gigaspora margarita]|uniref:40076_t:CDS:1 n=1 Tax=Gigaspora margarita TaxID=4874 RepID=A0ABN7UM44_GIGMA|nr:40076_t:CDS:2 [Gigaspora margarita]